MDDDEHSPWVTIPEQVFVKLYDLRLLISSLIIPLMKPGRLTKILYSNSPGSHNEKFTFPITLQAKAPGITKCPWIGKAGHGKPGGWQYFMFKGSGERSVVYELDITEWEILLEWLRNSNWYLAISLQLEFSQSVNIFRISMLFYFSKIQGSFEENWNHCHF